MDCKIAIMTKISMGQLNQSLGVKEKKIISYMRTIHSLFLEYTDFFLTMIFFKLVSKNKNK